MKTLKNRCKHLTRKSKDNPGKLGFFGLFFVNFYQVFLSNILGGNCRFYPSCSNYAKEAYVTFPATKATYYTIKRLLKCHPFGDFGYDPVPNSDKNEESYAKQ